VVQQVPGAQQHLAEIETVKALANLVEVDEETFRGILRAHERPTIVAGESGFWLFRRHVYLTTYDGFVFCVRVRVPMDFADDAPSHFLIRAKAVTIPFL